MGKQNGADPDGWAPWDAGGWTGYCARVQGQDWLEDKTPTQKGSTPIRGFSDRLVESIVAGKSESEVGVAFGDGGRDGLRRKVAKILRKTVGFCADKDPAVKCAGGFRHRKQLGNGFTRK
jgi:hypothetical protein